MSQGGCREAIDLAYNDQGCVGELLSSAHAHEKAMNRHCLLKIISTLRFQGCAIRGHSDETDGNFHQLLKLRGEEDEKVWLHYTYRLVDHCMTLIILLCRFLSG